MGRLLIAGRARFTVLAFAAAVALALAGCGSSSSNSASNSVARAAFVSTKAAGYQMRFSLQLTSSALPSPITGAGTGSINVPTRSGSLSLDMNLGSSAAIPQVLGTSTLHLEELIDGTTFYVKLPAALTEQGAVARRQAVDQGRPGNAASAAGVPGLSSLINNPPRVTRAQFLQYLRAAGTVTKQADSESVNGIPTTHYRAVIDLDKVADAVPRPSRARAGGDRRASRRPPTCTRSRPVAWIDGHNLVRADADGVQRVAGTGAGRRRRDHRRHRRLRPPAAAGATAREPGHRRQLAGRPTG